MARNNEKISLLIKKQKSINEHIFFDLLVDKIDESNKEFLRKLIEINNSYIEKKYLNAKKNLNLVKEDCLKEFERDKILRVNGRGLNPEQMIMYVLSTDNLVELLDFFKEEYFKYIEKLEENKRKILEKELFLKEVVEELENEI